jgi:hypothetical protein
MPSIRVENAISGINELPYVADANIAADLSPVELQTPRKKVVAQEVPGTNFLAPCEESVRLYKLQRELRKLKGDYKPGVFIPLNSDHERLERVYGSNGGNSSEPLDVYNITRPFESGDKIVLAGRLQPPGMNSYSKVSFFELKDSEWTLLEHLPTVDLEDPFVTRIDNQIIFGGVSAVKTPSETKYQTVFYKGETIEDLKEFMRGPFKMKEIRLVQLPDRSIGLFTRPQGEIGGLGQIGFTAVHSLDQFTPEAIARASLIAQRFPGGEWGGVNEAYALADGRILALGHRSYFGKEERNKHYYPWLFIHDPKTGVSEDLGIIGASDDFPMTHSRAEDLDDVIFSGGIDWRSRTLYAGVRDVAAGALPIPSLAEILAFKNSNVHQTQT